MKKITLFLKSYSLLIIYLVTYILTLQALTNFHLRGLIEGLIFTAWPAAFILIWSYIFSCHYEFKEKKYSQNQESNQDLFLIFFSLSLSNLILMILEKNNTDLLDWWQFIYLFQSVLFFIFSLIFSYCLQLAPNHKHYTQMWFLIILLTQLLSYFLPYSISFGLLGSYYKGYVLLCSYLIFHLVLVGLKKKFLQNKS